MINRQLEFNEKRICGVWLILIGIVIATATLFGGGYLLNPIIFMIGYGISFYIVFINQRIQLKLSQGVSSSFQNKMANIGIISLFILMFLISGPFFPSQNWRMIWLGAFLATGLHFFIFYYVHGKAMILLGVICSIIAIIGMVLTNISFELIGITDGSIKFLFGLYLLLLSRPSKSKVR